MTPVNVNDGRARPNVLPDDPGDVFADSAYQGPHFGGGVRAGGGVPRVVATSVWAKTQDAATAWLKAWNESIHHVRDRIE